MDSLDQILILVAAVGAIAAWVTARATKKMARARLDKTELQLGAMQRVLDEQRRSLRELETKFAAGLVAPIVGTQTNPPTEALPFSLETPAIVTPLMQAPAPAASAASTAPLAELVPTPGVAASATLPPAPGAVALVSAPQTKTPAKDPEATSLEEKIALVWFTRIGALALLFGVAFFFKYAVDNNYIGPLGRVALGTLAGAGVLFAAELTRARTKAVYLQVLLGVGLSFLFVSAYASHALYQLIPAGAAFAAIGVVTLLGGALSVRHRGEGVLVLSLLAGLLCPILLSTGRDLPGPLFAYLLVLTGLGFATSVRMGFRYATWLGIAGSTALFIGWYAKYFNVTAPSSYLNGDGDSITAPGGAYFPLAQRAIPLGAVAAFLAEWLFVQRSARRSAHKALLQPVALLVVALVLAHAGFSALLFDRAVLLGVVLAALALLSSLLLGAEEKRELLGIPLVASFLVLLGCAHNAQTQPGGMLAVLGLTGAIYAFGVLRGRATATLRADARTLLLVCGVGLCLALVSGVLLLELHPTTFCFVLAALSLAYAAFALVCAVPAIAAGAAALSFAGLLVSEPQHGQGSALFLGAAAVWATIYFATGAYELLARKADPTPARLFTLSGAGLGFAALVLVNSAQTDWFLRSGTLALIGTLDLAVGATLLRRGARQPATVLLGQALGLFAGAAAMLFSGATVTLIWAALAAVAAVLAASEQDPQWLFGAGLLFVFTLVRALAIDFEIPQHQRDEFFATLGRSGVLREKFLINTRAIALAGTATALLVSARALGRRAADLFRQSAFVFAALGHALIVVLLVCEARGLKLTTPTPDSIPFAEGGEFVRSFFAAVAQQQESLSMVTTVVMSIYAALLVGLGFGARSTTHRFLGLGLFALALCKLVGWDVWHLPRIEQMVVLVAMGALLLGSSYLYARFGKRLVTLLRDGELHKPGAGTAALLVLLAASLASGNARALEPGQFAQSRAITGVTAPGLYRVEIDPPLYGATRANLGDVRIAGPAGDEAPFIVREIQAPQHLVRHDATVVDPVTLPDGSTRAVLDLGEPGLKHSEVELEIEGSDFLRRTRIESSTDEVSFARLAEGAIVYRVVNGESSGAGLSINYPVSDARYLRVTLLPGADHQALQIRAAHLAYTTEATSPPRRTLEVALTPLERKPGATSSRFLLDVGQSGVPVDSLQLDIATPLFERHASIKASSEQTNWSGAGGGLLYRAAGFEGLVLHLAPNGARYFRVEIFDGDDPPLALRAARASYAPQELLFSAAASGPHTLFIGAPTVGMPTYDLGAIVDRSGDALSLSAATFGPLAGSPAWRAPVPPAPPVPPFSERYKTLIVSLLGLFLLGLALWTVRLLRSPADPGEPPK